VLGPVAAVAGAMQALAAIKLLSGNAAALADEMLTFDLWANRIRAVSTAGARRPDCPTCGRREFQFLHSTKRDLSARLCGQNSVQLRPMAASLSLAEAALRLRQAGQVQVTPFMVRCAMAEGGLHLTAFADGRLIVQGTSDPARARSVAARYFGS